MARQGKTHEKTEFGDFQTPVGLARDCCSVPCLRGFQPNSVVEPACGKGSYLVAALERFQSVKMAIGVEINPAYADECSRAILPFKIPSIPEPPAIMSMRPASFRS